MSEWHHSKNRHNSNFRKLLQEQIEKSNPRRELTAEETVQNRPPTPESIVRMDQRPTMH